MFFRWMISFLNVIFVFSLGAVTLWLFWKSLVSDRVRRPSPKQRAEFLMELSKDGPPLLRIPFIKSDYLIGRGPECDIALKGMGIPLSAGEIYQQGEDYYFNNFRGNSVAINDDRVGKEARKVFLDDEIRLYGYLIKMRNRNDPVAKA